MPDFQNDWNNLLQPEMENFYYVRLRSLLHEQYQNHTVYPPIEDVFNAFRLTPYKNTRVLILGQDPYHSPGAAHGLSFSVKNEKPQPSLENIFKEIKQDIGSVPNSFSLEHWAKQGVLLLNAVLTVRKGEPNSHKDMGWERFTDHVISLLNQKKDPVVFVLWGSYAQKKKKLVTSSHHYVIESPHPSPLSAYRGFFGSRPFSKINSFLSHSGYPEINWT